MYSPFLLLMQKHGLKSFNYGVVADTRIPNNLTL